MNPMESGQVGAQGRGVIQTKSILVLCLLLIAIVAIFIIKIRFPFMVALVIVGLELALLPTTLSLT